MRIFDLIQVNRPETACHNCVHFNGDPATIESVYPGLTAMSSGFASVRDRDGFCEHHQIYLSADDSCADIILKDKIITR